MEITDLLAKVKSGFDTVKVSDKYKQAALKYLQDWLTKAEFKDYVPQINYLIEQEKWDLLLDSFYQIIPFGTAGRRGPVGIGPNKINIWTIQSSAQGHAQYLLKKYGDQAIKRGVVIGYDVRAYTETGVFDDTRPNPVKNLNCRTLSEEGARVYAANGISVYLQPTYTSISYLSFLVRFLKAVAGDLISASHTPPDFNGIKVIEDTGGQLIPPYDQELMDIVVNEVEAIKVMDFQQAQTSGLIKYTGNTEHNAYMEAVKKVSLGNYRNIKALFSPYHGTSAQSFKIFRDLKFDVVMDPVSSKPDPKFSSILFNLPNPQVEESFYNLQPFAEEINADLILTADPDADRIGVMSKEKSGWRYYNGDEILILSCAYLLEELQKQGRLKPENMIIKTEVSTNFLTVLVEKFHVQIIGDLLVGFKYIGDTMNKLEKQGRIDDFVFGGEESNGAIAGNYIRDKDFYVPAIALCELAAREKDQGHTLGEYLDILYAKYGFYRNYLAEILLPGAEGMAQIAKIQSELRRLKPAKIGSYVITQTVDRWDGPAFLSESDQTNRNLITYTLQPPEGTKNIRVSIRPSGTEPKTKIYIEIARFPLQTGDINEEKNKIENLRADLEKTFMKYFYQLIGIDFPERGFLLFWQIPVMDKLRYFKIEPEIEKLKKISDKKTRMEKLYNLLSFLGNNPIEKVDKAFIAKNRSGMLEFLDLTV